MYFYKPIVHNALLRFVSLLCLLGAFSANAAVPGVPSLSVPSTDSDGAYTVSWGGVSGTTRYEMLGEQSGVLYSGMGRSSYRQKPNGTYYYKVRACNSSGCSSYSGKKRIVVNIPVKPDVPNIYVPSTDSDGSYTVSWSRVSGTTRYEMQGELSGVLYSGGGLSKSRYKSDGTYYYKVKACNSAGCSAFSAKRGIVVKRPLPIPATPSTPIANVANGNDISVYWSAVSNANHYYRQVSVNGAPWKNRNKYTTTNISLANQQVGTFVYRVQACNVNGVCSAYSGSSAPVNVLPLPDVPEQPTASVKNGDDITVSWTAVTGADHYYRQVSFNGIAWQNRNKYTQTSVLFANQQARTYQYRVQACNTVGTCSDYSTPSSPVTIVVAPLMAIKQFEWIPAEVEVGEVTAFHWNITNANECFIATEGMESSVPRAAAGQTTTYIYDAPVIHLTQWYCTDVFGNRFPSDTTQYLEATRTVKAPAPTVSATTVDIKNLNVQSGSYDVVWGDGTDVATYQLVEEKNGVWGTPQTITNASSKSFSSVGEGRYRYKVRTCAGDACSDYKTSAAFTMAAFNKSTSISDAAVLTGLSGDVGFTSGQFRVNESGAATYSVPLNLPEGVAGVKPQISLNYSSQGGDSTMGRGWSLGAGDAINRCPKNIFHNGEIAGVEYNSDDLFCLNGQQLSIKTGTYGAADSTYHTTIENFATIKAHGTASYSGPNYFTVKTKSGDTYYYGQTADSDDYGDAFVEPNNPNTNNGLAKFWALKKVVDVSGNTIRYHYTEDPAKGSHVLSSIEYGKNENVSASRYFNSVTFNYVTNPKPVMGYSGGSTFVMDQLLSNVSIKVDSDSYRYYDLSYFTSSIIEERNYLETITECIAKDSHCLAPLSFTWQKRA
ncbi:MAG: hypothetical protein HRT35_21560, partial [Algicola sp.]|nr:hypothetical protein [Algicola sp.]